MDSNLACSVCSSPPVPPKKNHSHFYGALVCLSCRAFFKRCIENFFVDGKFKHSCKKKSPGICDVSYEAKVKDTCKHCRYLKCLAVGMDSTKIKTGEEKEKYTRNNLYCFKKSTLKQVSDCDLAERMNQIILAYQETQKICQPEISFMQYLLQGHYQGSDWSLDTPKHSYKQ